MWSQSIQFWHTDYFELKLLKKQLVQEQSDPHLSLWKQEINSPCERSPPCTWKIDDNLIARGREFRAEKAVQANFVPSSLICYPHHQPFVSSSQIIVLCLKSMKAGCFCVFFESHISMSSCIREITFIFFLLIYINLITSTTKKPRRGKGKILLTLSYPK